MADTGMENLLLFLSLDRLLGSSVRVSLRREDGPYAPILLMLEHVVPQGRIFEREPVRREERGVEFAARHVLQQTWHVFLPVLLSRTHRQPLVHDSADRELVHNPIDAQDRQRPALAAGQDRLAQRLATVRLEMEGLLRAVVGVIDAGPVRLHPYRVDAGIRATSTSHHLQCFDDTIDLGIVDCLGSHLLPRHPQSLWKAVDADDPPGSHVEGTLHRHKSHAAPDGDGVPSFHIAEVGTHVASQRCI
nr:hypothetical protein [Ktedonospora formicarum]